MPSYSKLDLTVLNDLPARLDDKTLAKVERIANCSLPDLPPCSDAHLAWCLRIMSNLPRRADDDVAAKVRMIVYRKHLGDYCEAAITYLAWEATGACQFFPSPAECRKILSQWTRNDEAVQAKRFAAARAQAERSRRFDDCMSALKGRQLGQSEIDRLPVRWQKVAEERGYLRRREDGTYAVRADR